MTKKNMTNLINFTIKYQTKLQELKELEKQVEELSSEFYLKELSTCCIYWNRKNNEQCSHSNHYRSGSPSSFCYCELDYCPLPFDEKKPFELKEIINK